MFGNLEKFASEASYAYEKSILLHKMSHLYGPQKWPMELVTISDPL